MVGSQPERRGAHVCSTLLFCVLLVPVMIESAGCAGIVSSASTTTGVTPLAIATSSLLGATAQKSYSATLAATGGTAPYTWSLTLGGLPAGLTVFASGQITGTPTQAGTFTFTVQVKDSSSPQQTATASLSIAVSATPIAIATTSLAGGQVGISYSANLAASGGTTPYRWSMLSGTLPAGLALSSGGQITGTPTVSGTSIFAVAVADSSSPAQTASANLSIAVGSNGSATVGCGVTGTYPNLTQLDQSTCGNVITDGSILSYEPNYKDAVAINLNTNGCGAIYTNSGPVSFKLTANLNCGPTSNAFVIRPNSGGVGYYVNLNGFQVTGTATVDDNNGGFPDGTHVFGGSWTCAARPCLTIIWTNGARVVTDPMTVHHITWTNTSDNGEMVSVGANGAGPAAIPHTIVMHHNDVMLSGGTGGDPNRTSGLTENGTQQKVHYYNNKIYNGAGTNHSDSEGMVCYNAAACDVHNNWVSFNEMTLSNGTPGRMVLLDGDAFGNGSAQTFTTAANVYNNYLSTQSTRAVRIRSAQNVLMHDNVIDNCLDGPATVSWQACGTHWGDPSASVSGNGTVDHGSTLISHNIYFLLPPKSGGTGGGRAHWGNNAIGIAFKDERIACASTAACSANTQSGAYVFAGISNKSGTQYFNVTACRTTQDTAMLTDVMGNGSGQTQTSTVNTFDVGVANILGGATQNSLGTCP